MMDIMKESRDIQGFAIAIRRYLHRHPELSGHELNTVEYICEQLGALGIAYEKIPDGGVLGFIDGEKPGKTVLLRAECDALNIQEEPFNAQHQKQCISEIPGAAHMCGHDAHTAMLIAAGKILNENKNAFSGKVILLFERGEEDGSGIYYILKHIQENKIHIDSCWCNHVVNDLPVGMVAIQEGKTNAAMFSFDITLNGLGGHASRPDRADNPIDCFIGISNSLSIFKLKNASPFEPVTYCISCVNAGTKSNIIADKLRFAGTCRFFDNELGRKFEAYLKDSVTYNCKLCNCTPVYHEYSEKSVPSVCSKQCAGLMRKRVAEIIGGENIVSRGPQMGSETFAFMTAFYPCTTGRVGIRNEGEGIIYGVHNPRFDIDESGIIYGTMMNVVYALEFLNSDFAVDFEPFHGTIDNMYYSMNCKIPNRRDIKNQL